MDKMVLGKSTLFSYYVIFSGIYIIYYDPNSPPKKVGMQCKMELNKERNDLQISHL